MKKLSDAGYILRSNMGGACVFGSFSEKEQFCKGRLSRRFINMSEYVYNRGIENAK